MIELLENPVVLLLLALASFRSTRFLTTDVIFEDLREKVWAKYPPSTKFGYLWTCNWCMGFWVSIFFVLSWMIVPDVTIVVSLVLSISAIIGLLSSWTDR